MRILIARNAGFCIGVRRALNIAHEARQMTLGSVYTLGPLVHNPQVLDSLERHGIRALDKVQDTPRGATVIVRAHGISPQVTTELEARPVLVMDATCPRVKAVQRIIRQKASQGSQVIIVGENGHPEVQGLLGNAMDRGIVVRNEKGLEEIRYEDAEVCVVAQTTMNEERFKQIVNRVRELIPSCCVYDTICPSTHDRQEETRRLAARVEAMIVIGGRKSANTRQLAEISKRAAVPTYHVESEWELDWYLIGHFNTVGITAGASTPDSSIQGILRRLQERSPEASDVMEAPNRFSHEDIWVTSHGGG